MITTHFHQVQKVTFKLGPNGLQTPPTPPRQAHYECWQGQSTDHGTSEYGAYLFHNYSVMEKSDGNEFFYGQDDNVLEVDDDAIGLLPNGAHNNIGDEEIYCLLFRDRMVSDYDRLAAMVNTGYTPQFVGEPNPDRLMQVVMTCGISAYSGIENPMPLTPDALEILIGSLSMYPKTRDRVSRYCEKVRNYAVSDYATTEDGYTFWVDVPNLVGEYGFATSGDTDLFNAQYPLVDGYASKCFADPHYDQRVRQGKVESQQPYPFNRAGAKACDMLTWMGDEYDSVADPASDPGGFMSAVVTGNAKHWFPSLKVYHASKTQRYDSRYPRVVKNTFRHIKLDGPIDIQWAQDYMNICDDQAATLWYFDGRVDNYGSSSDVHGMDLETITNQHAVMVNTFLHIANSDALIVKRYGRVGHRDDIQKNTKSRRKNYSTWWYRSYHAGAASPEFYNFTTTWHASSTATEPEDMLNYAVSAFWSRPLRKYHAILLNWNNSDLPPDGRPKRPSYRLINAPAKPNPPPPQTPLTQSEVGLYTNFRCEQCVSGTLHHKVPCVLNTHGGRCLRVGDVPGLDACMNRFGIRLHDGGLGYFHLKHFDVLIHLPNFTITNDPPPGVDLHNYVVASIKINELYQRTWAETKGYIVRQALYTDPPLDKVGLPTPPGSCVYITNGIARYWSYTQHDQASLKLFFKALVIYFGPYLGVALRPVIDMSVTQEVFARQSAF